MRGITALFAGKIHDEYPIGHQTLTRASIDAGAGERWRHAVLVEGVDQDDIGLNLCFGQKCGTVVVNDLETIVIRRNRKLIAQRNDLRTDLNHCNACTRQMSEAELCE